MNPTTMQHLGQQPGRARLGACGPRNLAMEHRAPVGNGCWSASWHTTAVTSAVATVVATMPYVDANPTGDKGFDSIKRPARHLGTRST